MILLIKPRTRTRTEYMEIIVRIILPIFVLNNDKLTPYTLRRYYDKLLTYLYLSKPSE